MAKAKTAKSKGPSKDQIKRAIDTLNKITCVRRSAYGKVKRCKAKRSKLQKEQTARLVAKMKKARAAAKK